MATINSTPRAGLPQWGTNDQVKFMTDMSTAFSDIDKKFALTGDAVIPCTATYDTATKRHTLTPTQTGITLPDIFTARFLATTAFTAGDKVYIGGAEHIPSYTDGDTAVETGAWIVGAVVSLDCKKSGLKAYVGAGLGTKFSQKAPLASPALTGTATLDGKAIATAEIGTWMPKLGGVNGGAAVIASAWGNFIKIGSMVQVSFFISTTNLGTIPAGDLIVVSGLPSPPRTKAVGAMVSGMGLKSSNYINLSTSTLGLEPNVENMLIFSAATTTSGDGLRRRDFGDGIVEVGGEIAYGTY